MDETRIDLPVNEMPDKWYNVAPDLPRPLDPPLNPETKEPIGPEALAPIFPMELIKQEVSQENWIEIPDEVQRMLGLWRPTPLHRAFNLEKELKTPARIYYKNESVSPPGSHKPNTAVAQAYYNKMEGVRRICTETGAGQWGSALSFACKLLGLEATVYMVKCSYYQKPFRKSLMHIWGATVYPSPTDLTQCGRAVLAMDPESPGSLGCAISEAVEDAATHDDAKYSLGSVLNHVLLHQTIVGLEIKEQLKMAGDKANVIVGCVGGGSNFAGAMLPFVPDKLKGEDIEFLAVEPCSCPTLTKGPYRYDFGDLAKMTPLMKMYTLGHGFIPPAIHAGGLRYHGDAPILCLLVNEGVVTPRAYHQSEVFEASMLFAATEGLVCAPETSHAVKGAIDEALKCKETGEEKAIVLNYSGHGHFDLAAYDAYLGGELEDYDYPMEKIEEALKDVPVV